jgi:hypothetical protein
MSDPYKDSICGIYKNTPGAFIMKDSAFTSGYASAMDNYCKDSTPGLPPAILRGAQCFGYYNFIFSSDGTGANSGDFPNSLPLASVGYSNRTVPGKVLYYEFFEVNDNGLVRGTKFKVYSRLADLTVVLNYVQAVTKTGIETTICSYVPRTGTLDNCGSPDSPYSPSMMNTGADITSGAGTFPGARNNEPGTPFSIQVSTPGGQGGLPAAITILDGAGKIISGAGGILSIGGAGGLVLLLDGVAGGIAALAAANAAMAAAIAAGTAASLAAAASSAAGTLAASAAAADAADAASAANAASSKIDLTKAKLDEVSDKIDLTKDKIDLTKDAIDDIKNKIDLMKKEIDCIHDKICPELKVGERLAWEDASCIGGVTSPSIDNLKAVVIAVNSLPENCKQQLSGGQRVLYWGWFAWMSNGRCGERTPLSWDENIFFNPDSRNDGFTFGIYDGYSALYFYSHVVVDFLPP